jgi:transcriptional regulator with XRE-family HTH domain
MRLGKYLQSADISQTRFAAQIGVRQATISRYILGEQVPSVPIVVKIRDLSGGAVGLDDWLPEKKIRRRDALLPGV